MEHSRWCGHCTVWILLGHGRGKPGLQRHGRRHGRGSAMRISVQFFFPAALAIVLSATTLRAQTQPTALQRPSDKELHDAAGDIASDPGPIDTSLSPKLTHENVRRAMKKVE